MKSGSLTKGNSELYASEQVFLSLFVNLPVGVFQTTPGGSVIIANPALLQMLGYDSLEEFLKVDIGRDLYVNPEERRVISSRLEREDKIHNVELKLRRKDGGEITVLENANVVRDDEGRILYYQGILSDITERKKMEEELKKHKENLEQLVKKRTRHIAQINSQLQAEIVEHRLAEEKLRKLALELKQSNEELQQFAYVASHDLQEPLRMISSYTQLLARRYKGRLDQDADEFINFAVDGAIRMQSLINDLLAYSRVGTHKANIEETDCELIAQRVLSNLEAYVKERKAQITRDPLPTVPADRVQLAQVFQNLLSNAIKFCDKDIPQVHISARSNEREWIFSVSDNGLGISPEYFERIFMIFQRLHTQAEYPGTGIGLAICKKIAERHGGRIWVESEVGKGSTFYFSIPKGKENHR